MPTLKKVIRAGQLPRDWKSGFSDPDQLVTVTISDTVPDADDINLAAPSEADLKTLGAMTSHQQKSLYEKEILAASNQTGSTVSIDEIKQAARKLLRHG